MLPVYPATEGLSHKLIRALIDRHLDELVRAGSRGLLARAACRRSTCLPLPEALRAVHRPHTLAEAERGGGGSAFDELLDLQLMLAPGPAPGQAQPRRGRASR